jgi:hypothetical protein
MTPILRMANNRTCKINIYMGKSITQIAFSRAIQINMKEWGNRYAHRPVGICSIQVTLANKVELASAHSPSRESLPTTSAPSTTRHSSHFDSYRPKRPRQPPERPPHGTAGVSTQGTRCACVTTRGTCVSRCSATSGVIRVLLLRTARYIVRRRDVVHVSWTQR